MTSHPLQPWIPLARIAELVQLEPALLLAGLSVGAWVIYKLLLRQLSTERHRNLQALFRNLVFHLTWGVALFTAYYLLDRFGNGDQPATAHLLSYIGFFTILSGATIFVKVCRIFAFEYLFLGHMRAAVPVLLVNLFTLLMSLVLAGWIATDIFNVRLAPLLATSAIFSLVLGLALQDTLGNLFAGVALQFDKPYEIGDWIEIASNGQKWTGQVEEISWRATVLIGFGEEQITLPNRLMSQSEIANFTRKGKPVIRSQVFRIRFDENQSHAREVMAAAARQCEQIRQQPAPFVYALETTDSWITYKVVYYIENYGMQFLIGDEVIRVVLEHLDRARIRTAPSRLQLHELQAANGDRAACNPIASK